MSSNPDYATAIRDWELKGAKRTCALSEGGCGCGSLWLWSWLAVWYGELSNGWELEKILEKKKKIIISCCLLVWLHPPDLHHAVLSGISCWYWSIFISMNKGAERQLIPMLDYWWTHWAHFWKAVHFLLTWSDFLSNLQQLNKIKKNWYC